MTEKTSKGGIKGEDWWDAPFAGKSSVFIVYLTAKRLFWFIYVKKGWVKVLAP